MALVRIVVVAMPDLRHYGWHMALLLSVVTMTLGNVMGLWQDNLRRLLAYSSIAHTGYMLLALAVAMAGTGHGGWERRGRDAVLPVRLRRWPPSACLPPSPTWAAAAGNSTASTSWPGSPARGPCWPRWRSVLFSLTGIPPMAGFWGKLGDLRQRPGDPPGRGRRRGTSRCGSSGRDHRRVERGRGGGLLLADRGRDVFPHAAWHAPAGRRTGPYLAALASALLVLVVGVQSRPLMQAAMKAAPAQPAVGRRQVGGKQ